jgi:hypothetical protein
MSHHTLMMQTGKVPGTSVIFNQLTLLMAQGLIVLAAVKSSDPTALVK